MKEIQIHPKAQVSEKAKISAGVEIGPYAVIEDNVEIDKNSKIRSHAVLANGSRIGENCIIFSHAVIGTEPQDLKYSGEETLAIIGNNTVIREFATVNRGTKATGYTSVGGDCLIMTYCHIAHDCHLANNIIMSNTTQLGGHVTIEEWVNIGGVVKIHQFSNIGAYSFLGADCKIVKDVPPYTLIGREPPRVEGINKIGLRRRGFTREQLEDIEQFYNMVLYSGMNNADGIAKYRETYEVSDVIQRCIDFINNSERGIYR